MKISKRETDAIVKYVLNQSLCADAKLARELFFVTPFAVASAIRAAIKQMSKSK